jgi:hypothetical protein
VPSLDKLKEDVLINEFLKQWSDFTIIVHFMRKMLNYLVGYKSLILIKMSFTGQVLFEKCKHEVFSNDCLDLLQGILF